MKKLALGIATAVLLATAAAPAMAQVGFYVGPGGVGVGYYGCGAAYYDYYGGPNVVVGGGWGNGWHGDWRVDHSHFHGHR